MSEHLRISGALLRAAGRVAQKPGEDGAAKDQWKSFVLVEDEPGKVTKVEAGNDDLAVRVVLPSSGSGVHHVIPKVDTARVNDKDDVSIDMVKRGGSKIMVAEITSPFTLALQPDSGKFPEMQDPWPDLDDSAFARLPKKPIPVLVTDLNTLRKACSVAIDMGASRCELIVPGAAEAESAPFFLRCSLPGENLVLLSVRKTSIAGKKAGPVTEEPADAPLFGDEKKARK